MYVEEQEKEFKPVKLVLETQEEVDKLYAILTYLPIVSVLRIGCNICGSNSWYKQLEEYQRDYKKYFNKITEVFEQED